jgi:hypothetical protein
MLLFIPLLILVIYISPYRRVLATENCPSNPLSISILAAARNPLPELTFRYSQVVQLSRACSVGIFAAFPIWGSVIDVFGGLAPLFGVTCWRFEA